MNKRLLIVILTIIILAGGTFYFRNSFFDGNDVKKEQNKIQVVASFYPLWYFASAIGGDKAQVYNLTPAGAEPHEYELSTQDIVRIEDSRLLIINGGVEPWADKAGSLVNADKTTIITAGQGLFSVSLNIDDQAINDPHIWLDPLLAKKEVRAIADAFRSADPSNVDYYNDKEQELIYQLDLLDKYFRDGLADCRLSDFVTAHQAFGYLAKRYNLNQVAISGISTEAEPSVQQLTAVTDFAEANNVKYIFFESLVSPKLAETIANEVGAQTLVLDPLEGLSQSDIQAGRDYFSVMRDNLNNLQIALECGQ